MRFHGAVNKDWSLLGCYAVSTGKLLTDVPENFTASTSKVYAVLDCMNLKIQALSPLKESESFTRRQRVTSWKDVNIEENLDKRKLSALIHNKQYNT